MRYLPKSPPNASRCSPRSARTPSTISSPSFRPSTGSTAIWTCRASRPRARSSTTSAPPAQKNATGYASFLGAGAYRHYRPVIIDSLVQRGEFLTSYTPYQAEITQGTLQAIFEFQTMIAELTGMDVANASMYDGSTGAAEAVMMAVRVTGRHKAVVASTVHPEYREVLATYAKHQGLPSTLVGYDRETGRVDLAALEAAGHRRDRGRARAEPQLLRRH